MKTKTLIWLFALLLITIGVYVAYNKTHEKSLNNPVAELPEASLHKSDTTRIEITLDATHITVSHTDDHWLVNDYPVDTAVLSRFWTALQGSVVKDIVSQNPENQATFSVDDAHAVLITFFNGDIKTGEMLVGKSSGRGTSYIRVPNTDTVLEVRSDIASAVPLTVNGWRDKTILALKDAKVERIELMNDKVKIALEKQDTNTWILADKKNASINQAHITSFLTAVETLHADGFREASSTEIVDPTYYIKLFGADNTLLAALSLTTRKDGSAFVQHSGDDTVFTIPSYTADQLMQKRSYFITE